MVGVIQRMRKLKALLNIRLGPAAAIFPPSVKKLQLDFAYKNGGGHFAGRKFWRKYLPSLKYHNPAVSMTISRTRDTEGPSTLTIFFNEPSTSTSTTTTEASAEALAADFSGRTEVINIKEHHESEILKQVLKLTKATKVNATAKEEAEIQDLEEQKKRATADMLRNARLNEQKRQEKALLEQARGAVEL